MKKKDRIDKKRVNISTKKHRHWVLHEFRKELVGWHLYKGSHNLQRLKTNQPYFRKKSKNLKTLRLKDER